MKTSFLLLIGLAGLASAQTKFSAVGKCGSPDTQQAVEVGDRANHSLVVVKQSCTWTTPFEMAGVQAKTYQVSVESDSMGAKAQDRGYVVMVMDNGDKAFVRFQGTSASKDGAPVSDEGTWSYTGGTGKLKGLTGKGTYKGAAAADGFEDHVDGEWMLPAPKAAAPKK